SSRRRHTRFSRDWSSDVCSSDLQEVNREIARYVDVMIGNEEDFTASLGFEVKGADHTLSEIETDAFKAMIETVVKEFPNFKVAEIGRASCRERVWRWEVEVYREK